MKKGLFTSILLAIVLFSISTESKAASLVTGPPADYVIITVNDWVPALDYYVAQKTLQGYQPRVFAVEEIYLNYDGVENRGKILNFIRDAFNIWGISYVLLVGELSFVPSGSPTFPLDYYYTRLDGVNDSYPDVYIGRLPAANFQEVLAISTKWADYHTHGWGRSQLNLTGTLSPASIGSDLALFNWQGLDVYGPDITKQAFLNEMNSGYGLIGWAGHGAPGAWAAGFADGGGISSSDAYAMQNGNRLSFVNAMASCFTGLFSSSNSIARAFVQAPGGGAIGYIGANAEVLAPYGTLASSRFSQGLKRQYFENGFAMPGVAFHDTIGSFAGTYNLLGDPTAKMDLLPDPPDTTSPQVLNIQFSANNILPGQTATLTAAITDNDAVGIVVVAVTKPDGTILEKEISYNNLSGLYEKLLTRFDIDQPGTYSFNVTPKDISGNTITVQGPDLIVVPDTEPPQVGSVSITPQPAYQNQTIQIDVSVTDNSGLVAEIWADITKPNGEVVRAEGYDLSYFQDTALPGTYGVVVHARDLSGNEAVPFTTSFEMLEDSEPPVIVDYWVSDQIAVFPGDIVRKTSVDTLGVKITLQLIVTDNGLPGSSRMDRVWAGVTKPDLSTTVVDNFGFFGHWPESAFAETNVTDQIGTYSIVFHAQDHSGNTTQSQPLLFEVTGANQPPQIILPPVIVENNNVVEIAQGQRLSFRVQTFDPNGDGVTLWIHWDTTVPAGYYSFDGTTGEFSWTPRPDHLGLYTLTFGAMDDHGDNVQVFETMYILVVFPPLLPNAPRNLVATAVSLSQVDLVWEDRSVNEDWFRIERREGAGDFQLIASRGSNVTTYSDNTVSSGLTYSYRVYADNTDGPSGYSNEAKPSFSPPVLNPIGDRTIEEGKQLQFTVSASDADNNPLDLSASSMPSGAVFTDRGDGTGTFTWIPDYSQAGSHSVTFTASDGVSQDSESVAITVIDGPPSAPTGLKVKGIGFGYVTLEWTANGEGDISGYTVHYGTQSGAYPVTLTTQDTTLTVSGLTNGTKYYFAVKAKDEANQESGYSSEVNAVPSGGGRKGKGGGRNTYLTY